MLFLNIYKRNQAPHNIQISLYNNVPRLFFLTLVQWSGGDWASSHFYAGLLLLRCLHLLTPSLWQVQYLTHVSTNWWQHSRHHHESTKYFGMTPLLQVLFLSCWHNESNQRNIWYIWGVKMGSIDETVVS